MDEQWDVIIIGGGVAGLSAALMLGRARQRTLVIDAGSPRNRFAAHMHGVLGHDGIDPMQLLAQGRAEALVYGVEFTDGLVERLDETERGVVVTLSGSRTATARRAIIASGVTDELPGIPGLADHWGTRVLHCPYCHGWEVRDRHLAVLLTSPVGLHQAELVRQWSDTVTVFTAGAGPIEHPTLHRLKARDIAVVPAAVVEVTDEAGRLTLHTDDGAAHTVDAIFTGATLRPHDAFLAHLDLERTQNPFGDFIAVDPTGKTSSDRIWAAGNVVTASANVSMSINAGAVAGGMVNAALVSEDFDDAVAVQHDRSDVAPAKFWEERYSGVDQVWSGRPNQALVEVAGKLDPGRALDLGCGEGADVIWLAEQGWNATGIDISPTAIRRATAAAQNVGVDADRVRFEVSDLSSWNEWGEYDLVSASFLHSPVELPRSEVLRRAAACVAPGGHLLIVSHAAMPPWAQENDAHEHHFLSPEEEIEVIGLAEQTWTTVLAQIQPREASGPDGQQATLQDSVILVQRR